MRVIERFLSLQGEGSDVGTPALFIRLAGCHVGCPWCDTKQSWSLDSGEDLSIQFLANYIKDTAPKRGICVITGGEPFLQAEALHELIWHTNELTSYGVRFRIETSASVETPYAIGELPWNVKLNISPKFRAKKLIPAYWLTNHVNEFRFAIEKEGEQTLHWLNLLLADYPSIESRANGKIYLSPINKPDEDPSAWARDLRQFCINADFRYSYQMHKMWGIA